MRYLPKDKIDEIFEKGVASVTWGEVRIHASSKFFPLCCCVVFKKNIRAATRVVWVSTSHVRL